MHQIATSAGKAQNDSMRGGHVRKAADKCDLSAANDWTRQLSRPLRGAKWLMIVFFGDSNDDAAWSKGCHNVSRHSLVNLTHEDFPTWRSGPWYFKPISAPKYCDPAPYVRLVLLRHFGVLNKNETALYPSMHSACLHFFMESHLPHNAPAVELPSKSSPRADAALALNGPYDAIDMAEHVLPVVVRKLMPTFDTPRSGFVFVSTQSSLWDVMCSQGRFCHPRRACRGTTFSLSQQQASANDSIAYANHLHTVWASRIEAFMNATVASLVSLRLPFSVVYKRTPPRPCWESRSFRDGWLYRFIPIMNQVASSVVERIPGVGVIDWQECGYCSNGCPWQGTNASVCSVHHPSSSHQMLLHEVSQRISLQHDK